MKNKKIKENILKTAGLFLFYLIMFLPILSQAQILPCTGRDCANLCQFGQLGINLINFAFKISIVIAVILIIYGGFRIITAGADPGGVKTGRSVITNTIIGLAIVFGSWLIVDTIIKFITGGASFLGSSFGPWNDLNCQALGFI